MICRARRSWLLAEMFDVLAGDGEDVDVRFNDGEELRHSVAEEPDTGCAGRGERNDFVVNQEHLLLVKMRC